MQHDFQKLGAAVAARRESLCAMVPALRMAAVGLTRCADAADELVHDTLLQAILLGDRCEEADLLPELLSRMRNAYYTRTRLNGWTGKGRDEPEGVMLAQRILDLPAEERGPLILVRLLGARPELACGLCGCGEMTLARRLQRAEMRVFGWPMLATGGAGKEIHAHH